MTDARKYWDMRSQVYDQHMEQVYRETNLLTLQAMSPYLHPTDHLLDFGCGTGFLALGLSDSVKCVQAIDTSPQMLKLAQMHMEEFGIQNVHFFCTDLYDSSLKERSFHTVTAGNVLCYLNHWDCDLARLRSLLCPGGIFLSVTDCLGSGFSREALVKAFRRSFRKMPYEAFFTQKGLIKKIQNAGFQILESRNLHRFPPNLFIAAKVPDSL